MRLPGTLTGHGRDRCSVRPRVHRIFPGALVLLATLLPCVSDAGNWEWDQSHDCTIVDGEDGKYDLAGKWVPAECCQCNACNVYALSGGLFHSQTDISVPGCGPALKVRRTYNSVDLASGLMGAGWTFSLGRNGAELHVTYR